MNPLQALAHGFSLIRRLWAGLFWFWLATAFLSALMVALLPYEVQNNQAVAMPLPSDPGQRMNLMILTLGLFLISAGVLLALLGGTVEGIRRIEKKEPVGIGALFRFSKQQFGRVALWGISFFGFCVGLAMAVVIAAAFLGAAARFQPVVLKTIAGAAFWGTLLAAGFPLLYSFVPATEGAGIRQAFGASYRFFRGHVLGTILLVLMVATVGAMIWWVGVFGGTLVNGVRASMGIPAFTKAFVPAFLLGLLVWWPQAVISVLIPASLYAYYRGNP